MARNFPARRMTKEWNGLVSSASGLSGSTTVLMTSLIQTTAGTIIRMLGDFIIGPTPAGTFADGDHVEIGIGIAVLSGDAVTLGSSAMPDPVDEPGYPWLWRQSYKFLLSSALGLTFSELGGVRVSFDSRSMRKIKPAEALAIVVQYVDIVGASPMTVSIGNVRFLKAF